jgi:hypothetical protein
MTRPMTCDELDPIAREAARALAPARPGSAGSGWQSPMKPGRQHPVAPEVPGADAPSEEVLQSVREHLRGCPACARRLDEERRLDARLTALATADEPPPPPTLEQHLTQAHRARFGGVAKDQPNDEPRRRTSPPPSPADGRGRTVFGGPTLGAPGERSDLDPPGAGTPLRSNRPRVPMTAAAVVIAAAAAAAVTFWWRQRSPDPMVALQDRLGLPVPAEERPALPVMGQLNGRIEPARRDTVTEVVVRAGDGRAAAFVPLGWDTSVRPIEIGRVTRVRMPTSIAARFGWPLLPDAPEARVAADVLVGEDGTARALRFLPATFTPVSHDKE